MNTRVALVRIERNPETHTNHPRHLHPPLALKYIQAALNTPTMLADGWLQPRAPQAMVKRILAWQPELAVIQAQTWCIDEAIIVSRALRDAGVITIAVGQHVSHVARMPHPQWAQAFDISVLGEPEQTVPELIQSLVDGEFLDTLATQYASRMARGASFLVQNPDQLPHPRFNAQELLAYAFPFPVPGRAVFRWGYVMTSWGCPNSCKHCSEVVRKSTDRKLRLRDPENVVDEIAHLLNTGAEAICFEDDSLFSHQQHIVGLCEAIVRRGLTFPWIASVRPDELDEERVLAAAQAGAVLFKVGVESGDPAIIETIGKACSGQAWLDKVEAGFTRLHRHGIGAVALFMLGTPGEDYADVEKSIALAKKLQPDYVQVQMYCAYPDSEYFSELAPAAQPPIDTAYHYLQPSWTPSKMAPEDLPNLQSRFYSAFYFRPTYIARHIWRFWRFYSHPQFFSRVMRTFKTLNVIHRKTLGTQQ